MKKIALVTFLISSFTLPAFAKTQGSYVGLDFVNSRMKFYEEYTNNSTTSPIKFTPKGSQSNDNYGVGLSYKYAFNHRGFFVAPGIIAEFNDANIETEKYGSENQSYKIRVRSRFGAKVDFGFDVSNLVSPYATVGYAAIDYKTRNFGDNSLPSYGYRSNTVGVPFVGGGLKINLTNQIFLNVEYNIQKFDASTKVTNNSNGFNADYNTRFDVLKAGLSYNF